MKRLVMSTDRKFIRGKQRFSGRDEITAFSGTPRWAGLGSQPEGWRSSSFRSTPEECSLSRMFKTWLRSSGIFWTAQWRVFDTPGWIQEATRQERGQPCPRELDLKPGTRGQGCPRSNLEPTLFAPLSA